MAILKHIASKSSNYGAALEYLIFKHDELRKTPILDQNGNRIMRDEFYLDGLNCEPYSFDAACQQLNREYQKNKNKNEIKSHHYIISFDPRDSTENCLTGKRAQELGLEYAKANFPGHQALVCTHMDGHNFARIMNELNNAFSGRNEVVDRLCGYPLLVIDDFGMERGTEYALEQIYNIIDSRYRSRKPLIVTTNLTLTELKNPQDTAHARIYDRLLELCTPIACTGPSMRKDIGQAKLNLLKTLLA